jgi:REP element-mobilizing transposase RayT
MARKTRGSLIKPDEITIVHTVAKTVRNLFLFGGDLASQTHNSNRKDWILDIIEFQSSLMAIDLLGFALMSNHIHQILRSRPDVVKKWDNLEVARRWMTLCPKSKKCFVVGDRVEHVPIAAKETQIQALAQNEKRIAQLREQLSSISWWMRLLCQKVAQRVNIEDGGSLGHVWKGRFHATVIENTDYLLGCTFYVDLNAVKAGLALGIDDYKYTSAKIRLDMLRSKIQANDKQEGPPTEPVPKAEAQEEISVPMISKGEFLSVMKIDTLSNDPQLHTQGYRCSDKGFLDHTDKEYLRALEWCITNKIFEREVKTLPEDIPDCIRQHRFGAEMVLKQAKAFGKMYRYWTGREPSLDERQSCSSDGSSPSV